MSSVIPEPTQPTTTDYIDFCPIDTPLATRRKLNVGDIYINQIRCHSCGWHIRSKNRHDFVTCKCGKVSLDGGSWYQKINGDMSLVSDHSIMYKFGVSDV